MIDEEDPKFWNEIDDLGWVYFDHAQEKTKIKYGTWYPVVIDVVAQSLAAGFIGTEDFTFRLVSARRGEDWNNGPTAMLNHRDAWLSRLGDVFHSVSEATPTCRHPITVN